MSDLIRVVDLELSSHIGVPEEERSRPQRLLLTLEMDVGDTAPAATDDDIRRTVNYFDVAQLTKKIATAQPRQLLETLAEDIARELLAAFPIQQLRLELKKFILPDAAHVSVVIERPRRS